MARGFTTARSGLLKFVGQFAVGSSDALPGLNLDHRRRSRSMKSSNCPPKGCALLRSKQAHYRHVPIRSLLLDDGKEAIASLVTVAPETPAIRVDHPPGKPSSLIASLSRSRCWPLTTLA